MPLGPVSVGAILGVLATLVSGGIPLYYRYIWGEKSHVFLTRFETLFDSEWRDGRSEDESVWSRRCLVRVSNSGWRDAVISVVELEKAVLKGRDGTEVFNLPEEGVQKIELEHFASDGTVTRIEFGNRTYYAGQIIAGRDDEMMAIIPFLRKDSGLGNAMKEAKSGKFTFSFQVEDHKRIYFTSVEVGTSLK